MIAKSRNLRKSCDYEEITALMKESLCTFVNEVNLDHSVCSEGLGVDLLFIIWTMSAARDS